MKAENTTWNNVAKMYEDKFMSMDIYNNTYDQFCTSIKTNASILEVGCGPGNITNYLTNQRPDLKILATDYAPNMVELAKKNVPNADVQVLDARKINTIESNFNGVIAGFILPYFTKTEVQAFFQNCHTLMHENGTLYFSFVAGEEADSHIKKGSTGDELFFRYHENEFIEKSLESTGFKTIEKFQIPYEGGEAHEVIIVRKTT